MRHFKNKPTINPVSIKIPRSKHPNVNSLSFSIAYWCNKNAVTMEEEYLFHPNRKWRFDFAIPAIKIAIEYEGIYKGGNSWGKNGHTTISGIERDIEKGNEAVFLGWKVIRVTALNYKNICQYLDRIICPVADQK